VKLLESVVEAVSERPLSGGALIEAIPVRRDAVLVYGALAQLAKAGRVRRIREGPGEVLWGVGDASAAVPRAPGPPESFRMGQEELAWIEAEIWRMTEGLSSHYFEELRRAAVSRADRIAYEGAPPRKAAQDAVASLGTPAGARRFLARIEAGSTPKLRLRGRTRIKLWILALLVVAAPFLFRMYVVGWYALPEWQVSMAPTLMPGVEGGDEMILADLVSYRWRDPRRGEIVVFRASWDADPENFVKRVLGLPGETITIRDGDVFVDGRRLIKERPVLDAVSVPLFGSDGFERDAALPGFRQSEGTHTGFRLPDGTVERRHQPAGDIILEATVRVEGLADSVVLLIEVDDQPRHQVVLTASGYESGVFVEGHSVVRGSPCQLQPGRDYRIWITNADRLFRVELDGVEIARHTIKNVPGRPHIEVVLNGSGAAASDLSVARDLTYTTNAEHEIELALGADEYCLLGDNSPVSRDSRQMGPIHRSTILGRLWRVVWPLNRARLLTLPR